MASLCKSHPKGEPEHLVEQQRQGWQHILNNFATTLVLVSGGIELRVLTIATDRNAECL